MGLEQMRNCRLQFVIDGVIVHGVCKKSNTSHTVKLTHEEYEAWQKNGIPLSCAAPHLSGSAISFLTTGVWNHGSPRGTTSSS